MKKIIQNLKSGDTHIIDFPILNIEGGSALIRSTNCIVSTITERILLDFGKANIIQKVKQQPDKFKQVLDKIKTNGLLPTIETVR